MSKMHRYQCPIVSMAIFHKAAFEVHFERTKTLENIQNRRTQNYHIRNTVFEPRRVCYVIIFSEIFRSRELMVLNKPDMFICIHHSFDIFKRRFEKGFPLAC